MPAKYSYRVDLNELTKNFCFLTETGVCAGFRGFCSDGNCEGENGEVKVEQKKEGMLFTKQLLSQAAREKVCTQRSSQISGSK